MSYYNEHNSPGWKFFVLAILLIIAIFIMRSCISNNLWDNGICSYCGGHYKFQQAIGHRNYTSYMYICDTCGRSIEVAEHYMEVQDENTE